MAWYLRADKENTRELGINELQDVGNTTAGTIQTQRGQHKDSYLSTILQAIKIVRGGEEDKNIQPGRCDIAYFLIS